MLDYSKINDFNKLIQKEKFKKIFIISGKNSFYKSSANTFFRFPKKKNFKNFFKKSKLPEFNELNIILKEIKIFNPDIILAIGGGAVIDYAKIASIIDIDSTRDLKKKLILYENISKNKVYPLIAIPTTAGAGAEVTSMQLYLLVI